jgi:hypothetical protein
MELDSRISAADFTSFINTLNAHLVAAYSVRGAVVDNLIAVATWWTSLWWRTSTFETVRPHSSSRDFVESGLLRPRNRVEGGWQNKGRGADSQQELRNVEDEIQRANERLFNPAGLNVLTPRDVALQFVRVNSGLVIIGQGSEADQYSWRLSELELASLLTCSVNS